MKRILAIGSIVALSVLRLRRRRQRRARRRRLLRGIHKAINTQDALGLANVGEVVKAFGGQGKNDAARGLCGG